MHSRLLQKKGTTTTKIDSSKHSYSKDVKLLTNHSRTYFFDFYKINLKCNFFVNFYST